MCQRGRSPGRKKSSDKVHLVQRHHGLQALAFSFDHRRDDYSLQSLSTLIETTAADRRTTQDC